MWEWIGKYWLEALFGAIVAGLSAAYAHLAKKFKTERAKNAAIERITQVTVKQYFST